MKRSALLVALSLAFVPGSARATGSSLPSVAIGPRPGPAVLYAPLATTPILENTGVWEAEPLMISGMSAYVNGEFLYQDYIYDDHGANTTDAPFAPPDSTPASTATAFGGATGDLVYPTVAAWYGSNAADILEVRARAVPAGIAYRITLNTMLSPTRVAIAIGINTDRDRTTGTDVWPDGIGSLGKLGLEHIVTILGDLATLDGAPIHGGLSIDEVRNQVEVIVPLTPGTQTWRHHVVTGVNFQSAFAAVGENPTATNPGGAHGTVPPPIFNVAFRLNESMGGATVGGDPGHVTNLGTRTVGFGHWREHDQAKALAARDIARFFADIEFGILASGASFIPRPTGWVNRLYVSHLDLGEGVKSTRPMLMGKIQPYGVYVPTTAFRGGRKPLHVEMHSLSCTYNQYAVFAPRMLQQLGEERDSFLLTPAGRGPDGWYHDEAEVDLFEAWADLAARYDLDPDRTTLGGYSMGGYGTYKIGAQYPDLFARGFAVVGPMDENIAGGPTGGSIESVNNTARIAENLWNIPLLMWNGTNDELVPVAGVLQHERILNRLRLRHRTQVYPGYDHFLFSVVDDWTEGRDFLGTPVVDRDPVHVKYRAMPRMDVPALGLIHDHAYWVSDVRVATGAQSGLVDARSEATTRGRPFPVDSVGASGPTASLPGQGPYVALTTAWGETEQQARNALTISLTDVASATLWIERAGIDPSSPIALSIDSTTAATITLAGTFGTRVVSVGPGHTETVA